VERERRECGGEGEGEDGRASSTTSFVVVVARCDRRRVFVVGVVGATPAGKPTVGTGAV